jgi:hypothetical protein
MREYKRCGRPQSVSRPVALVWGGVAAPQLAEKLGSQICHGARAVQRGDKAIVDEADVSPRGIPNTQRQPRSKSGLAGFGHVRKGKVGKRPEQIHREYFNKHRQTVGCEPGDKMGQCEGRRNALQ